LETISYALAVNELTAELLVDRLDPRDITVSADGRLVAFVAAPVGQPEEHPRNAVWLAQSDVPDSARRFTSGTADDRGPQFAPDGTSLYFLSDREERKVAQLYRVSLEGGEARPLTEGKPGIAAYAPLADGRRVVLVCADAPSEEDERREQERDDPTVFGDWKPQRMRLLDLEAGETRTLTYPAEKHVSTVAPAPEGSLAAVVLWETPEIDNRSRSGELVVIDVDVDEIVARWRLAAGDATVVWRGSGDLRILGSVEAGGQAGLGLFVAGLDDEELQLVTGSLDADPMSLALGSVVAVARGLDTELARLGDDEGLVPLSSHPGTLFALAASSCGDVVACVAYHRVPDVWAGPPDGELVRVSNLAPELAGVEWARRERLTWRACDGLELDGLLLLPRGRTRAGGPFPLVMVLHGGPYWRFADDLQVSWASPGEWLAAEGYAVFCPNPRGGLGHGAGFARSVRARVGIADWPDVESGLDHLVQEGVADPERLALGGWSQGGYMTAWGVTQTSRFCAAVIGAGPSDWGMMVAESDMPTFEASLGGSAGWEGPGPHRHDELSPISYAHRVTTPTLILHGEDDERVPIGQARFFARALRAHGVEFELVSYPREPHTIGERNHLLDLLARWREWLSPRLARPSWGPRSPGRSG